MSLDRVLAWWLIIHGSTAMIFASINGAFIYQDEPLLAPILGGIGLLCLAAARILWRAPSDGTPDQEQP